MEMEIKYNTRRHRWEVYGPRSVIRAGEKQPVFVAAQEASCRDYARKAVTLG